MSEPHAPSPPPDPEPSRARPRWSASAIASAFVLALAVLVLVQVAFRGGGGTTPTSAPTSTSPSSTSRAPTVAAPARSRLLAVGDRIPSFTAPEMLGGRVSWDRYLGGPVVLAVWAPWCPHCQAELPVLAAVTTEFPKVSLVSVATAVDPSGPTPMQYMQATGLDFPVALDDSAGTLAQAFGIRGFPTIFFVGADGSIRAVHEGEMSAADLRSVLGTL